MEEKCSIGTMRKIFNRGLSISCYVCIYSAVARWLASAPLCLARLKVRY